VQNNIKPEEGAKKFESGSLEQWERANSNTIMETENLFLYHYYTANRCVFLLNLYKILGPYEELAFSIDDIKLATRKFDDVAIIITAADWINYDPTTAEPKDKKGLLGFIRGPSYKDTDILDNLNGLINMPDAMKLDNIVKYAQRETDIDCFSVAVPDRESPKKSSGELTRGENGYEIQGYGVFLDWLMD
jgi:hypothetical protein